MIQTTKRYGGNVGIEAVQQAAASKAHYGAQHAVVVSNSSFTDAARSLARSNDVELVDRPSLIEMLAAQLRDEPCPSGLRVLAGQVACGVAPLLRVAWVLVATVFKVLFALCRLMVRRI